MSTASVKTGGAFKLAQVDPEQYRQQTRKASWIIIVVFVSLAMLLSSLLVQFLGEPGGDNFRFNLAGVVAAVIISAGLVRSVFSKQPWMAANVYGWQLKRSLMSVTNVMHKVKEGVAAQQPTAMLLLRFYHLGVMQMHRLDGNTSEISQMVAEVDAHQQNMQALGLDTDQPELNPAWLQTIKIQ
ncbi:MAG: DUF3087 domain-containing protein [Gammaproteobacteria bacterium]|nr:DUF3087 domain-containing protein [Gammaproteobacteria bacterium]